MQMTLPCTCGCCAICTGHVHAQIAASVKDGLPAIGRATALALFQANITGLEQGIDLVLRSRLRVRVLGGNDDPLNPDHGFSVQLQPGHYITQPPTYGPRDARCDVMVIGRAPSYEDNANHELFYAQDMREPWLRILVKNGIKPEHVYVTNAVRFTPPRGVKNLKASWLTECHRLLLEEVARVKPASLLLFGRDAVSAVLGRGVTLAGVRGATDLTYASTPVVVSVHPYTLTRAPEMYAGFAADVQLLADRVRRPDVRVSAPTSYVALHTEAELQGAVDEVLADAPHGINMDCEWGSHVKSDYLHGHLRTVQFSSKPKRAFAVVLRKAGLFPAFENGHPEAAVAPLRRLVEQASFPLSGHAFRSDVKFLHAIGVSTDKNWAAGFDTMLGWHLLQPNADGFGLEILSTRFTDLGRYDIPVATWLKEHGYGKVRLEERGYADVPDALLLPYAMADVDVGIRCVPTLVAALKEKRIARPYALRGLTVETLYDVYRATIHPATVTLNEVETTGVYVDYDRLLSLIEAFGRKKEQMQAAFTQALRWPAFNLRSVDHVRELLFGPQPRKGRVSPEGAVVLNLEPLSTTDKPARDWNKVPEREKNAGLAYPSTGGETLLTYALENDTVKALRQLRTVDQVIKNFLCPPDANEDQDDSDGVAALW